MQLIQETKVMLHIPKSLLKRCEDYLVFECDFHKIFIYPHKNKKKSTTMIPFIISKEDIQLGIVEWNEEYQPPFEYEKAYLET
jgi:hypothetical protein